MLDRFSPAVRAWFSTTFAEPTDAQRDGWPAIADGEHTLICAPTGSGKTLAAFLWGIDRITSSPPAERANRTRIVYVSPLRALAFDVEKNLRAPIAGIELAAERLGVPFTAPIVGMRTGDTSARDRAALVRHPPDILITTPESLYLMLTSNARETLTGVEAVIVDEIHALAPTKRGAHLALSLERLEVLCQRAPQRIGLSATQRPLEVVARFLGGYEEEAAAASSGDGGGDPGLGGPPLRVRKLHPRPVAVVDAGIRKPLDVEVIVPVEDMSDLGQVLDEPMSGPTAAGPARKSIWPSVHPRILDEILAHRSTIVFCNARRLAERLAARLNELAFERLEAEGALDGAAALHGDLVKAHHGSLAREQRVLVEDQLKAGRLRGIVATSSLELGIDMGAVDLVVQVESPGAVSRGLQRIGRAGHQVGEPSKGKVFPKHRGDLLEAAVVVARMREGAIEATRILRNPLDVLAQQIVAMCAVEDWDEVALAALVRRCANFAELTDDVLAAVLDLLAGRYPSAEFGELRPRIVWDRVAGRLRAREGSRRLAVTSGGTIPDRGLFGVFLPDGTRVGELDEEMVYESRPGDTFLLGASTWRIEDITFERVVVTPAPGEPGKMPFWHGDRPGRPLELGQALGRFVREVRAAPEPAAVDRLRTGFGLDAWAAGNVVRYLADQAEATGVVPDDRTIVVERFRDEIGDWRVCVLTPFGTPVHAPWAMAIEARLGERFGVPVETLWSDDGIVVRLPEAFEELPVEDLAIDPDEIDELVIAAVPSTSLFAARFRECAARALLLPRRRPDKRTPLWQQRQRAADLLAVASKYPSFPILMETTRECVQDVFDLPALRSVLADVRARRVRIVSVDTPKASPFAQSLLFNWIAAYMYEGDAPLAERRAAALALDRDLLRELLGAEELRELIDPEVLADLELDLQLLSEHRRARSADELHDVVRRLGDLSAAEVQARCAAAGDDALSWLAELVGQRRVIEVRVADEVRYAAAEDAARLRDALGVALPVGLPAAFTTPVPHPLDELVARYARTHGPFLTDAVARRLGTTRERIDGALGGLEAAGRVVRGEFRPGGWEREWCDVEVLRQLRRRSLAALRREVEPVDQEALARFLPAWHAVGARRRGVDALVETIAQLQGAPLVASVLEREILPARVDGYRPADLDALCAAGELVWVGAGAIGAKDGRIRLAFREQADLVIATTTTSDDERPSGPIHDAIRMHLDQRGACFWNDLRAAAPGVADGELLAALWDLVWAGEVTNDTLAPLRSFVSGKAAKAGATGPVARGARSRPRLGSLTRVGPPAGAGRWSLVASMSAMSSMQPSPTERSYALAQQLMERYGVLTREAVLAEEIEGGFAAVYPVLKVLEERGQLRRGYFVAGLGGAQFALPGAVDRLRSFRDPAGGLPGGEPVVLVMAATDPAQPYGAALAWPPPAGGRPARTATAVVVLVDGRVAAWFDRASRHLVTFPATGADGAVITGGAGMAGGVAADGADRWIDALIGLVKDGRDRSIEVRRIDGEAFDESVWCAPLVAAGFARGYKGLTVR